MYVQNITTRLACQSIGGRGEATPKMVGLGADRFGLSCWRDQWGIPAHESAPHHGGEVLV